MVGSLFMWLHDITLTLYKLIELTIHYNSFIQLSAD
jgi:hypothetical protein